MNLYFQRKIRLDIPDPCIGIFPLSGIFKIKIFLVYIFKKMNISLSYMHNQFLAGKEHSQYDARCQPCPIYCPPPQKQQSPYLCYAVCCALRTNAPGHLRECSVQNIYPRVTKSKPLSVFFFFLHFHIRSVHLDIIKVLSIYQQRHC